MYFQWLHNLQFQPLLFLGFVLDIYRIANWRADESAEFEGFGNKFSYLSQGLVS